MLRRVAAAVALALAGAAAADPQPERGYGLPRNVSADGGRIDWLLHFTLVAILIVFAIVGAILLVALVRPRRGHPAAYQPGSRLSVAVVVIGVGLVALVVDGNLFVRTIVDMEHVFWNFAGAEERPGAVRIEVNAHQWAWQARYPSPDGKFNGREDVVTLDDIRVPVGVPVVIQLASVDVIHSLYLPNFRVKQDAVPGMITRLTFQATTPGEYEIACAQHCGPNHYKMRGVLTVLPPDQWRQWLETARGDARRAFDPDDAEARWGWDWRAP